MKVNVIPPSTTRVVYPKGNSSLKERGITLTEILVSISIGTLIMAISAPQMRFMTQKTALLYEVKAISQFIRDLIRKAQLSKHELSLSWRHSSISITNSDGILIRAQNFLIQDSIKIIEPKKTITAYPNGSITPTSFRMHNSTISCLIIVSLRGRVRHTCATKT